MRQQGSEYDLDLLVFVVNEPFTEYVGPILMVEPYSVFGVCVLDPIARLVPNCVSLFVGVLIEPEASLFGISYIDWLDRLDAIENRDGYGVMFSVLKEYRDSLGIATLVVVTPENHNEVLKGYVATVTQIIDSVGLQYPNLYAREVRAYLLTNLGDSRLSSSVRASDTRVVDTHASRH